ncbi:P-II family nitrogen regulator [Corynebacterium liangguodongii]|uniref:P-II family nitrogen regulator n=1 Tax=Corynebacterium liangguodongii TaxID=2079535 RepID=A0A2S0WER7_9CORY|nr:P-II family nitrogen regulator [Corynebacterium liangguodongii]AWB84261.1 P-II family nitrogen regulator [Corynebacterium liangguodongii]PWC00270.1 P-II family nitrogen regulator [Corynebacterium liangguodongii]
MKLITAVVKPFTLTDIVEALEAAGINGITVSDAQGRGRQHASIEYYRGAKYSSQFVAKAKVEVLVRDELVEDALDSIVRAAYTGEVGDGKIWVTSVERVIRVRTGETDDAAITG